jgi:hypothetical protein
MEGKYKREHGGHRWNLEAEKACFSPPGAFKACSLNFLRFKNLKYLYPYQ